MNKNTHITGSWCVYIEFELHCPHNMKAIVLWIIHGYLQSRYNYGLKQPAFDMDVLKNIPRNWTIGHWDFAKNENIVSQLGESYREKLLLNPVCVSASK